MDTQLRSRELRVEAYKFVLSRSISQTVGVHVRSNPVLGVINISSGRWLTASRSSITIGWYFGSSGIRSRRLSRFSRNSVLALLLVAFFCYFRAWFSSSLSGAGRVATSGIVGSMWWSNKMNQVVALLIFFVFSCQGLLRLPRRLSDNRISGTVG